MWATNPTRGPTLDCGAMLRIFITGLLAALPLAATILIFVWGARLLYGWVGPGSLVGKLLVSIGLGVTGSEVAGYGIGVLIVVLLIFALGLLVQTRLRGWFGDMLDAVMQRIPLVRSVYDVIKKFVGLVSQRDEAGMRSMSPVWLHFGGIGGAAVLGLLSTPEPVMLSGKPYLAVLVPDRAGADRRRFALRAEGMGDAGRAGRRGADEHLRVDGRDVAAAPDGHTSRHAPRAR